MPGCFVLKCIAVKFQELIGIQKLNFFVLTKLKIDHKSKLFGLWSRPFQTTPGLSQSDIFIKIDTKVEYS